MQKVTAECSTLRPARELAGKTAIVTGSTSGIGLGIAHAFAEAGMHVMLNGFGDKAEIEKTRMDLEESCHIKTAYSAAAMSNPADIVGMVEDARRLLGKVDVLVNNAGIQHVEAIETFPIIKWDAIIAIDLSSAFDRERRARHGGGGVTAKEQRKCADLLRRHEPARRLGVQKHVPDHLLFADAARPGRLGDLLLHQRRQHVARADGIDGDAVLGRLQRYGLGEAEEAVLGCHVGRLER